MQRLGNSSWSRSLNALSAFSLVLTFVFASSTNLHAQDKTTKPKPNGVGDGPEYMKRYISKWKSKKVIVSATPIKTIPAGDLYKVATCSLVMRDHATGGTFPTELYIRYGFGRDRDRIIRFVPFTTEKHDDLLLNFVLKVE